MRSNAANGIYLGWNLGVESFDQLLRSVARRMGLPKDTNKQRFGTRQYRKCNSGETTRPKSHSRPNRHPIHIHKKGKGQKQMTHHDDGQPGRSIIGPNLTKALAAYRAMFHLLEVALHKLAFATTGTAPQ